MNTEMSQLLRNLVHGRSTAALATLHDGDPALSMVPFAITVDGDFIVHVSGLAAHTADMTANPRVSLMVVAPEESGVMPQALPRVAVSGDARRIDPATPEYASGREAYLARFPDAEPMFGLGDFSLFAIRPRSARLVGGFAQASTISATDFAAAIRQ